jgi:flagella basal body P-ring formation protein FlgA
VKNFASLAVVAAFAAGSALAANVDSSTLKGFLDKETAGIAGRVETSVGEIDPRLRLAPCARVEPFLPPGARLWGRGMVGVRCAEGAKWTTYVPFQVRVFGPALVAARAVPAGKVLDDEDLRVAELELTRESPGLIADPLDTRNRVLVRALAPGQPLRATDLRGRPAVAAGEPVQIMHVGAGFTITMEGRALAGATDGEPVRVQTDSGRVLTGTARPGRVVEVRY